MRGGFLANACSYLADPDGDFVEAIGRQHSAEAAARIIVDHINDWKGEKMW